MALKAQVTVEFILIFMVLLLALNIVALMSYGRVREITDTEIHIESNRILEEVSNKLNTAWLEGDGFESTLELRPDILGLNYSIDIVSNSLALYCRNVVYSKYLLTQNITGELSQGQNLIKNQGGQVLIL